MARQSNIMFSNLRAEMARNQVTIQEIANTIGVCRDAASQKLSGKTPITLDVELDPTLQEKIRAKEQAKQDAEIAELNRQTVLAQAETDKAMAQAQAEINLVTAQADADVKKIEAQAEADANRAIAASITPELIALKEAEARMEHGWVTVQGAGTVVAAQ